MSCKNLLDTILLEPYLGPHLGHTANSLSVTQSTLPFFASGAWISDFRTTFGWLQDVLFTHVHGVAIL